MFAILSSKICYHRRMKKRKSAAKARGKTSRSATKKAAAKKASRSAKKKAPAFATVADYLYFSFVTQTTVGYGDLTAAGGFGRALAVLEALIGQLYLVTVIALLVSNLGSARRRARERDETVSSRDPG